MNRSMPGLPVHHQLLEFTHTHVHRVSDAIQPSHPLSSPSSLAPNPSLSITNSRSLLKLTFIELVMPSNHPILCHPLPLPPSIFWERLKVGGEGDDRGSIRVFSNESALCIRWPKYWSFSFNLSPSNEYSGLIFFRMDWFDFLAIQRTLKSLLQHHNSKASILLHSVFFIVQLSHPYLTVGKTKALTRCNFVDKVTSLVLNCCLGWS